MAGDGAIHLSLAGDGSPLLGVEGRGVVFVLAKINPGIGSAVDALGLALVEQLLGENGIR
jgi:hypothetical protein